MLKLSPYKLKANALQFVVYVVVLVAILLSMLLLYIHLNNRFVAQSNAQIEAIELCNQGIHGSLKKDLTYGDTLYQTFDDQSSIKILKQHWGVFDRLGSFAEVKDKTFKKAALIGGETPFNDNLALYLQDNDQALVVVGDTKVKGSAYLGAYGVKPGQISGRSYTNRQLIFGNIKQAGPLPNISLDKLDHIKSVNLHYLNKWESMYLFDIDLTSNLNQSFFNPTAYYFSDQSISLFGKEYSGNMIIQSRDKIHVDASSRLKNTILIAPSISISRNFKGSLQALATDNIEVGPHVQLEYPSALLLDPKNGFGRSSIPQIKIGTNTELNGVLAYLKGDDPQIEQNSFSHIQIGKKSIINGQIFCAYNLDLNARVNGHTIVHQFLTPYRGSFYIDHILDVNITSEPVSADFSGLIFRSNPKNIALWLN